MPLSELRTMSLPVLAAQFSKVLEAELSGTKYKTGDRLPDTITEWFKFGVDVFSCIRGSTYTKELTGKFLKLNDIT